MDTQFPHTITTRLVIAEIICLNTVDAPVNSNPCCHIAQLTNPIKVYILFVCR